MENFFEGYSSNEVESAKGKIKYIEKRRKEFKILKDKLEKEFSFEIVNYIIDDIFDCETYHHICLIINLAVVSNRLSEENGKILKKGIKELFNIDNDYDIVRKEVYMYRFNYEEWSEKYHNKEFIDLMKYLNDADIILLNKLDIELKDKIYTNYEFDIVEGDLIRYYRNEDEMIEKISELINDSKLRNKLGLNAKEKAKEFSKEKIVKIWENILK